MAKQNKDKRKRIGKTFWGMYLDNDAFPGGWFFLLVMFAEFLVFSSILLGKHVSIFGMLAQYLIGAAISLEICFVLFNLSFKKTPNFINVLGYKGLSLVWGVSIYNIILIIGFNYNRLGYLLMVLINAIISALKPIFIIACVCAAVGAYLGINYLITKKIEEK
jgi:hypothetical protein